MRRVNVIGSSCAGKSIFAAKLAGQLKVPHIELDALHWEPGWVAADLAVFRNRVATMVAGDGWVIDGNYRIARDLLRSRIDTIVWLDYSFGLVLCRAIRRTIRRVFKHELCCNGNRETLRQTFSRDSILLWVLTTHARRRREYRELLPAMKSQGIRIIALRTPEAAERFLNSGDR